MAEQSYGDWIRSNPPLPTKRYKKEHMAQQITDAEIEERTHLLELVKISTEVFSRQQYERLKELSNKMFASAGSPHIAKENTKHMAQQTAVEWFSFEIFNQFELLKRGIINDEEFRNGLLNKRYHAKQMEKEQIGKAYYDGYYDAEGQGLVSIETQEQYYNDKYKTHGTI